MRGRGPEVRNMYDYYFQADKLIGDPNLTDAVCLRARAALAQSTFDTNAENTELSITDSKYLL